MELDAQSKKLEKDIPKLEEKISKSENDRLSVEQFLNLSKNAGVIVESANVVAKDVICREIFLNFSVDEEKVLKYRLKEPFATLLKDREILSGRDGGT